MSAYVIVDIDVTDPGVFEEYKRLAPPTVSTYGGKYLARGGRCEVLEGNWFPKRLVILRFDTIEQAKLWLDSPEYQPIKSLRHMAAHSNMIVVEGVD